MQTDNPSSTEDKKTLDNLVRLWKRLFDWEEKLLSKMIEHNNRTDNETRT